MKTNVNIFNALNESFEDEMKAKRALKESKENKLNEAVFEIDYAPDGKDLSTEEAIINNVKEWLGDLANQVKIEVKEVEGPAGGWPIVRLSGNREELADFLYNNYNSGADTLDDILDLYLVKDDIKEAEELNETEWNLTLDSSIRKAINDEDYDGIIAAFKHYNDEVQKANVDKSIKDAFQDFINDHELEFADIESLEVDDPEEAIDYLLTDFYDLCDNTGVFIQIGESAELKENINPNELTKEQLWKLRKEIRLGSIYIDDYKNSFGIEPQSVCNFFDSFIEDAQQDDDGSFNNRNIKEFDNADELYNYYLSCENPFGESAELKENSIDKIKGKLKDIKDKEKENMEVVYDADADKMIKDYYNHKYDLEELHNKLKNHFGSVSKASKYLTSRDQAIKKSIKEEAKSQEDKGLNEDETVILPQTEIEPDYIISDVTVLNQVGDGDVQAPDIDGLLTLVDESLKAEYGDNWGHINILSSKINENNSFALVDISTPEIIKQLAEKEIFDAAIGKNLILENKDNLVEFKVNSLNGVTRFSKVTDNPQAVIKEWIETEFLNEAKQAKVEMEEIAKAKEQKEVIEEYIAGRADLKAEIENIKMFIELAKTLKASDEMKPAIQDRMYGFVIEFPANIEVSDKGLSFNGTDELVEIIFGKEWVKEPTEDNEVVGLKESEFYTDEAEEIYKLVQNNMTDKERKNIYKKVNKEEIISMEAFWDWFEGLNSDEIVEYFGYLKESSLKESYSQFNIGDIEVVFNPETYECLYSIPSAEVKDKKINLTKIPSVDTPYDTNTIIKSFVETKFGVIPSEEAIKAEKEVPTETLKEPLSTETTEIPVEEAELPEEPGETEEAEPILDNQPEETLESQAETGSAVFVKIRPKQVSNLRNIRERLLDGDTPTSSYIVVDTIDLSDEDWDALTSNLNTPQPWLENIKPIDRKNYSFNVIKVTNAQANYALLIDPLGYNYSRYIAIEE